MGWQTGPHIPTELGLVLLFDQLCFWTKMNPPGNCIDASADCLRHVNVTTIQVTSGVLYVKTWCLLSCCYLCFVCRNSHVTIGVEAAPQLAWDTVHYISTKLSQSSPCPQTFMSQHWHTGILLPWTHCPFPTQMLHIVVSVYLVKILINCKPAATVLTSTKHSVLLHITNHITRLHSMWEVAAFKSTHKEAHTLLLVQVCVCSRGAML